MNEMIYEVATMLFCILLVAVVFAFTPYYIRKTDAFGVSIPEEQYDHPRLAAMRRAFRNSVLAVGLLSVVICGAVALLWPRWMIGASMAVLFVQLGLVFGIFYRFHRQARALKAAQNWQKNVVTQVAVELGRVVRISPLWTLLYLLPVGITTAISVNAYPGLPQRIPMNFNLSGEVTGYAEKSWRAVLLLPGTQLMMMLIFGVVLLSISRSRMVIDPQREEESLRQGNTFRLAWSLFLLIGGFGMICMFMLLQMAILGLLPVSWVNPVALVTPLLFIGVAMVLSFKLGQGGSRMKNRTPAGKSISVRDDDRYWKLGSFYYNPEDPAVFVEKRFGVGWTCNFARPMTYVLMAGLAAIIIFSLVFAPK